VDPLYTREESRDVDRSAMHELGIDSLLLMENAGRGATDAICEVFGERLSRVVLVGGPGQNGGDAWVVARRLTLLGHRPLAVLLGQSERLHGDAQANWAILGKLGVETVELSPDQGSSIGEHLRSATLVVDGLFGTGLDRPIAGGYADAVLAMDEAAAPLVSLDLPSGLDADTGTILGVAPKAALTITFGGQKRGLHQYPGVERAGLVRVADIGVPIGGAPTASVWTGADLRTLVAPRPGEAVITLFALDNAFVTVRQLDDSLVLFSGKLARGDSRTLPHRTALRIEADPYRGIELEINGLRYPMPDRAADLKAPASRASTR